MGITANFKRLQSKSHNTRKFSRIIEMRLIFFLDFRNVDGTNEVENLTHQIKFKEILNILNIYIGWALKHPIILIINGVS